MTCSRPTSRSAVSTICPCSPSASYPCSTAFCSSSVSTIASAVAVSDGRTPKLPSRRTRTRLPTALTSVTIRLSGSTISSKSTHSPTAWLSVSWTIAIDPTRRTASSSASRAGLVVHPARLEPQQRGDGLQVVLHPVVDLADGRVLGDQLTVAAAQVGHVADQDQRADVVALRAQRDRAHDQRDAVGAADLGVAVRPAAEDRAQRLLVGSAPRRHQLAGQVGEREPGEVAGETETAVDRERVRARVDHVAGRVDAQEAVADPRGVRVVAAVSPGREVAVGDHLGQVGGGLQVGQLQAAGGADPEQVGVAGDDRDHPAAAPYRDRLHPHRHVVAPLGVALADQPALARRPRRSAAAGPTGTKVPITSSTYAVGPVVGRIWPAAQNPRPCAVRQPEHQVGEGEVRDDLPVRLEQLQPGDVVAVEVGVAAHEIGQGRHAGKGRTDGGPDRLATGLWQDGSHVGSYWSQVHAGRPRGPVGPPARRPDRRADPDARRPRSGASATARRTPR